MMTLDEVIDRLTQIRDNQSPGDNRGSLPVYVYDEGWARSADLCDPVDDEETPYIMITGAGW